MNNNRANAKKLNKQRIAKKDPIKVIKDLSIVFKDQSIATDGLGLENNS